MANVKGPIEGVVTNPTYVDVTIAPGGKYTHPLPKEHSAFVYVFEGEGVFGPASNPSTISTSHIGGMLLSSLLNMVNEDLHTTVFSEGDFIEARAAEGATSPFRFLLIAAKPLKEPVCHLPTILKHAHSYIHVFITDCTLWSIRYEHTRGNLPSVQRLSKWQILGEPRPCNLICILVNSYNTTIALYNPSSAEGKGIKGEKIKLGRRGDWGRYFRS